MSAVLQYQDRVVEGPPAPAEMLDAEQGGEQRGRIGKLIDRFGSLSGLIRQAGVAAVVVSMCLFLFDGLSVVNDTMRFYSMLMLTGLLSAGGIVLAFALKEQRGARSFFGLALLSVPVNFAVLGALFYSVFQFDSMLTVYPTLVEWKISDVATLGTTMLIALAALVPVTIFSVSIMARDGRAWLSTALLASSAMLLLPVRDATWIAPIVAIMVFSLIALITRYGEHAISLKTNEGRVVQSLLFLPPLIMLIRSLWLYGFTSLSALVIALTVFASLRYVSKRLQGDGVMINALHLASSAAALATGVFSISAFTPFVDISYSALIFCAVFGGLMLELESRIQSKDMAEIVGISAALIVAIATVYHQLYATGLMAFIVAIVVVVAMLTSASLQQKQEKIAISVITFAAVLLLNGPMLVNYFLDTGWLGFASLGATAILIASVLDRFGPMLSVKYQRWMSKSTVEQAQ